MLRTRAGQAITLLDLLSTRRSSRPGHVLRERSPDRRRDERPARHAVGIGAVKYADLSTQREQGLRLRRCDRMLSLEGNTSVYLQYADARAARVLRGRAWRRRRPAGRSSRPSPPSARWR